MLRDLLKTHKYCLDRSYSRQTYNFKTCSEFSSWQGFEVLISSSASVYSCSERFDGALISNYDFPGVEQVVNFACPVVRNKMILLSAANPIILFFSKAKNNHLNNKSQQEQLTF